MPTGGEYGLPNFDPTFEPAGLSSRSTTPNMSFSTPSGGGGGGGGGGFNMGGYAGVAQAGMGLLGSAFAQPSMDITGDVGTIEQNAGTLQKQGAGMVGEGKGVLAPALAYFKSLASGNEADVMAATAPERARVIDQYSGAQKALQFNPRAGGTASASATIASNKARDLAVLPQQARSDAMKMVASLGTDLEKTGLSAEESATNQLSQILGPIMQQGQQSADQTQSMFSGIGMLMGAMMFL